MNKFILLSHPRSGTTYFASKMLKRHEDIMCFDEILNKKRGKPIYDMLEKNYGVKPYYDDFYEGDKIKYLETFYENVHKESKCNHVGFKLFHSQLSPKIINQKLIFNYPIILLRRINIGKAALSWEIAMHTKQWGVKDKKDFEPFAIDLQSIKKFMNFYTRQLDRTELMLTENKIPYLLLYYENLFNKITFDKVSKFLGTTEFKRKFIQNKKLNSVSRYAMIKNIEEIRSFIIDLGYSDIMK